MSAISNASAVFECKIKRPGGSFVDMGDGTTYHFSPDYGGRHVAVIDSMEHITKFMQIPDYALLNLVPATSTAPDTKTEQAPVMLEKPPVTVAPEKDEDGTALQDDLPTADSDGNYSEADEAAIRAIFKAELGRVAPPKSKPETMVAQIIAAREARGA